MDEDPTVPADQENCKLLSDIALVVQAVMGVLVLLSLVYKRHRERPMRPWRIWLFDVSKQIVGQGVIHLLNIGISALVSRPSTGNNACTAYFMNVTFDVTFGVGIIWLVLRGATTLFTNKLKLKGFKSGSYGDPPSYKYWIKQASVYIVAVVIMKLAVLIILAAFPPLLDLGDWLLSWTDGRTDLQIVFVMGVYPVIMNVLQFWIIDSIVKASAYFESSDAVEPAASSPDREPLFNADGDSDDSDVEPILPPRRHQDLESQPVSDSGSQTSGPRSRQASSHSSSSEVQTSNSSSRQRKIPTAIATATHDYPPITPPTKVSPLTSPGAFKPSLRKRSPPPSPSPAVTPHDYGSTQESPRMRSPDLAGFATAWDWAQEKAPRWDSDITGGAIRAQKTLSKESKSVAMIVSPKSVPRSPIA